MEESGENIGFDSVTLVWATVLTGGTLKPCDVRMGVEVEVRGNRERQGQWIPIGHSCGYAVGKMRIFLVFRAIMHQMIPSMSFVS